MRVLVLGNDGYIGWPLALHLLSKDYEVAGIDNLSRRQRVKAIRSQSLTPIASYKRRLDILEDFDNFITEPGMLDLHSNPGLISEYLEKVRPDVIVHLAEMPSAPWSMIGASYAAATQVENVIGTLNLLWAMKEHCPEAHLVKLGTMGEYGTPDCDIPEGEIWQNCAYLYLQETHECPMKGLPFPRSPGSFYHLSKVHDTHNIIFACKIWGLRSTDIMQGVVFGLNDDTGDKITRFDYDEYFGTVINRFIAQALYGMPLTVYGKGEQTRGFIPLEDVIQCLTLTIENPPKEGEYRVFNQFEQTYTINELADIVAKMGNSMPNIKVGIQHIDNPRKELEQHYYNPAHQKLFDLGYKPTTMRTEIAYAMTSLSRYTDRILPKAIMPTTTWK